MSYSRMIKDELIRELERLTKKVAELERADADYMEAEKLRERGLPESEMKFRAIFNAANDGILLADPETKKFHTGNKAVCQMMGYTEEELIQLGVDDIHPEEDLPYVKEQFEKQAKKEITVAANIPVKRKDGSVFFAEVNSVPVTLEGKTLLMGIFRDVTERIKAKEIILKGEARLAEAQRIARVGNWDWDIKNNTLWWSDEIYRIFGLTPREFDVTFEAFLKVVHPDDRSFVQNSVARALRKEKPYSIEHRIVLPDGSERVVHEQAEIKWDETGEAVRMVGTVQDVTERMQLENLLHHSMKMEAIGRLAGGVAHDFNNLLTGILGYSQLILDSLDEDNPICKDVEEIKKAGESASVLTKQLLAFSRKQVLEPRVINMNETVSNIEKMLRRVIGEDIDLVIFLASDLGHVHTDPNHIEQVIMNLAVNAKDAMPHGGKLTIETGNADLEEEYVSKHVGVMPGSYVMLAVSDTGIGMNEETRSHIFEPFFTTKEKGKGTGLGLATVYGIIKQSGGNIWVYSEPGKGTTFKIYMPRVHKTIEDVDHSDIEKIRLHGTETILLVEDEDLVREFARRVLTMNGYTVLEACNGDEAMLIGEKHEGRIHLMITDVIMPGMSGPELEEHLLPLRSNIKVIYISGYAESAIVHHGVLDSDKSLIQKPFTPNILTQKVREILDSNKV